MWVCSLRASTSYDLFRQIFLAGLILQLLSFLTFFSIYCRFLYKIYSLKPAIWSRDQFGPWFLDWRALAGALVVSSIGILVSIFFRYAICRMLISIWSGSFGIPCSRTCLRLPRIPCYDRSVLLPLGYASPRHCKLRLCAMLARKIHSWHDSTRGRRVEVVSTFKSTV